MQFEFDGKAWLVAIFCIGLSLTLSMKWLSMVLPIGEFFFL